MTNGDTVVLLAEDQFAQRLLCRRALEGAGLRVLEASDGAEGLELARGHAGRIDLLVSDVQMPRLDGFELAAILRTERPGLKVLFVSGHAGRPPCGSPLLAKPFRAAQLTAAVMALLAGQVEGLAETVCIGLSAHPLGG
jgi:CheY-like chemotaxis protein